MLLDENKASGQDFEWYPTTDSIIRVINQHLKRQEYTERIVRSGETFMDIGAGDGRVLTALSDYFGELHAIEKSVALARSMPKEIRVVGGDFWEQSLIDKPAKVTFCNPPYSEFTRWVERIINETASELIYLVIPVRWKSQEPIMTALKNRKAKYEVLATEDFLEADRKARATVDVLKIHIENAPHSAFDQFFNDTFSEELEHGRRKEKEEEENDQAPDAQELVTGAFLIERMVGSFNAEMQRLQDHYRDICRISPSILRSMDASLNEIKNALKEKIKGAKSKYWKMTFDRLDTLTSRLTKKTRESMLRRIAGYSGIDYTAQNIHIVVKWALDNANTYLDEQFLELYDTLSDTKNVRNYKSNKKVFEDNRWRSRDDQAPNSHYLLEYRIVTERVGGLHNSEFGGYSATNGLSERATDFLNDLMTVAGNLGFTPTSEVKDFEWESGQPNEMLGIDTGTGEQRTLVRVKAFLNGNMHLFFDRKLMQVMNVEHGRLKGWIHKPTPQSAEEMGMKPTEITEAFGKSHKFTPSNMLMIEG